MAVENPERIEDCVVALIEAVLDDTEGTLQSVSIDYQTNGELPFRVMVAEEQLPLVGLATLDDPSD